MRKRILVLGANSVIGDALYHALKRLRFEVYGTSRRENSNHTLLDVTWKLDRWPDLPKFDSIIVCASLSEIGQCENDPELSYVVNISGLEKAIKKYKASRTQVIFLSTSHVFSGKKPFVAEGEPPDPQNVLGMTKTRGERIVLKEGGLVVRVSKVIGPLFPRFVSWVTKLTKGEIIEAYSNLLGSLVLLDSFIEVLLSAIHKDWRRIVHISGPEELDYYEMARMLARNLCCNEDLVVPVQGCLGNIGRHYPHTTLRISRVVKNLNIKLPDTEAFICEWLRHFENKRKCQVWCC